MFEEFQVFKSLLFRKRTEGSMRNEKLFLLMVDIAGTDPVDRTSLLRELFANLQYPCLIHNPPFLWNETSGFGLCARITGCFSSCIQLFSFDHFSLRLAV